MVRLAKWRRAAAIVRIAISKSCQLSILCAFGCARSQAHFSRGVWTTSASAVCDISLTGVTSAAAKLGNHLAV